MYATPMVQGKFYVIKLCMNVGHLLPSFAKPIGITSLFSATNQLPHWSVTLNITEVSWAGRECRDFQTYAGHSWRRNGALEG